MDKYEELKNVIEKSQNICVFTGAGISCPSGIPDFRSADGLYNQKSGENYTPEEMVSHSFFCNKTELFYKFYKEKMLYPDALPNAAHLYFAELEKKGKIVSVVTQNIDGLHQAAGSTNVFELHGSVLRNYCTKCGKFYDINYIINSDLIPYCEDDGKVIKPDVVLYEESLDDSVIYGAVKAISEADTLIVVGTSLLVYPAASFLKYFSGNTIVLINKSKTGFDSNADLAFNEDVIEVINKIS